MGSGGSRTAWAGERGTVMECADLSALCPPAPTPAQPVFESERRARSEAGMARQAGSSGSRAAVADAGVTPAATATSGSARVKAKHRAIRIRRLVSAMPFGGDSARDRLLFRSPVGLLARRQPFCPVGTGLSKFLPKGRTDSRSTGPGRPARQYLPGRPPRDILMDRHPSSRHAFLAGRFSPMTHRQCSARSATSVTRRAVRIGRTAEQLANLHAPALLAGSDG